MESKNTVLERMVKIGISIECSFKYDSPKGDWFVNLQQEERHLWQWSCQIEDYKYRKLTPYLIDCINQTTLQQNTGSYTFKFLHKRDCDWTNLVTIYFRPELDLEPVSQKFDLKIDEWFCRSCKRIGGRLHPNHKDKETKMVYFTITE